MTKALPRYIRVSPNSCTYNLYVDCSAHDKCDQCGWNPKVSAERLRKVKGRLEEVNNDLRNRRYAR